MIPFLLRFVLDCIDADRFDQKLKAIYRIYIIEFGFHCFSFTILVYTSTRHFAIAVVRRFFKMGPEMVERRLKTVRRLFHPLHVVMCAMLNSDDAYFRNIIY